MRQSRIVGINTKRSRDACDLISMLFNEEGVVSTSDAELLRFLLRDAEISNDNGDVSTSNVCRAHQGKKGRKEAQINILNNIAFRNFTDHVSSYKR